MNQLENLSKDSMFPTFTMRGAFKRWLELHNEEWRNHGYVRIPNWFRWYIRKNCIWTYHRLSDDDKYIEYDTLNINNRRQYKGAYNIYINDEDLLKLERPEWIK